MPVRCCYYGYPWDYHDRTDRMLNRLEEYGGGSPCGGVVYKEDVWPERYRETRLLGRVGQASRRRGRLRTRRCFLQNRRLHELRRADRRPVLVFNFELYPPVDFQFMGLVGVGSGTEKT